jgi:TrmH family RNA methyltransferase
MPDINSNQNTKIKLARSLKTRKHREKTDLFLVEGLHHVGEALTAGVEIEFILYQEHVDTGSFQQKLLGQIRDKGIPNFSVTENVYRSLSEKENIKSLIAVIKQKKHTLADLGKIRNGVGLITPQDPGNIGTILRTIDAVGSDALFLIDGGADPYNSNCIRASMGTIFWKSIFQTSFADFIEYVQKHKIKLYGTSAKDGQNFNKVEYQSPAVLLLGSEQKGLSDEHKSYCDELLTIKMRGRVSSLNLSIAASILLYSMNDH